MNEYSEDSLIEGPWVIKRNGIYYLQYSASGTQWLARRAGWSPARHMARLSKDPTATGGSSIRL